MLFAPMSAHPEVQPDAVAAQLVAALASYEQEVEALLAAWPDMAHYEGVGARIDDIRRHAAGLPTVSVQFVALLIAHTELVHVLWTQVNGASPQHAQHLQAAREQHRECAAGLRLRCKALLSTRAECGPKS